MTHQFNQTEQAIPMTTNMQPPRKKAKRTVTLFDIPCEVLLTVVFSFLSTENVLALRLVDSQFNSRVMNSLTWRSRTFTLFPFNIQSINDFMINNNNIRIPSFRCYGTLPPLSLCSSAISTIQLKNVKALSLKDIEVLLENCINLNTFKLISVTLQKTKGMIDLKEKQLNLREIEFHKVSPRRISTGILKQYMERSPSLEVIKHYYTQNRLYEPSIEFNQFDVLSSLHLKTAYFIDFAYEHVSKLLQCLALGSSNTLTHASLIYWDSQTFLGFTPIKYIPMCSAYQLNNLKSLKCSLSMLKWLIDSDTINTTILDSLKITVVICVEPQEYYHYLAQIKHLEKLVFTADIHVFPDRIIVDTLKIKFLRALISTPVSNMKCRHYHLHKDLQYLESLLSNPVTGLEELTINHIIPEFLRDYNPKPTNKVHFSKVNLTIRDNLFKVLESLTAMIEMTGLANIRVRYGELEADFVSKIVLFPKAKYLVLEWDVDWSMLIALLLCFPKIEKFRITLKAEYKKITYNKFAELLYTSIRRLFGNQVQEVLTQFETHVMCEATAERRKNSYFNGYILSFNSLLTIMEESGILMDNN
jgi:hypothetical protein